MKHPDESRLLLAFAPLHKAAFGAAVGLVCAALMFLATAVLLITGQESVIPLGAFSAYFRGYSVTWEGAAIGAAWAGAAGFVFGWFTAFCRNLVIAISVFIIRTRAERAQIRDFLDHV